MAQSLPSTSYKGRRVFLRLTFNDLLTIWTLTNTKVDANVRLYVCTNKLFKFYAKINKKILHLPASSDAYPMAKQYCTITRNTIARRYVCIFFIFLVAWPIVTLNSVCFQYFLLLYSIKHWHNIIVESHEKHFTTDWILFIKAKWLLRKNNSLSDYLFTILTCQRDHRHINRLYEQFAVIVFLIIMYFL